MTNEEIRAFFWDRVESFDLDGAVDIEALLRVFSVENPDEALDSVLTPEDGIDPVRYIAMEVAELYRAGWRLASPEAGAKFFENEDSPLG
jgi:hypothetical protein